MLRRTLSSASNRWLPRKGDTIYVGMSGGVDSSVVCQLLAHKDSYNVKGIFMRNWDTRDEYGTDNNGTGCEWEKDWEAARSVARTVGISCELVDLSKQYWNRVFNPSLEAWSKGRTPNPDVACNRSILSLDVVFQSTYEDIREIKFGALLSHIPHSANDRPTFLATGHYSNKNWIQSPSGIPGTEEWRPLLTRGVDPTKDQSYYLSSISESSLRRALFPLGRMTKPEVRELAKAHNLPTAVRAESMGICFVGERGRFNRFLSSYIPPTPGIFADALTGKVLGAHEGLWMFTVGENARIAGLPHKMFVSSKDYINNVIWLVNRSDHPLLHFDTIDVENFHWIWAGSHNALKVHDEDATLRAKVQFRYRSEAVWGTVKVEHSDSVLEKSRLRVNLDSEQVALAEGQVVALYVTTASMDPSIDSAGDNVAEEWACLGQGTVSAVQHSRTEWKGPPLVFPDLKKPKKQHMSARPKKAQLG